MRLDIIAKILEDAGLGVQGQSIFIHRMGEEVAQGILIRVPIVGTPVNPELPDYYKGEVQVIVRASTQAVGDGLAKQVMDLLTIYNRDFYDAQGVFQFQIKQMYPMKLPIVYPRSTGYATEWSMNMHLDCVMI
jgi:hypothetical protein